MLTQLLYQVFDWLFGCLTMALLARFLMQWARAPFRNPLGAFVIAITDWAVKPLRRVLPGPKGLTEVLAELGVAPARAPASKPR